MHSVTINPSNFHWTLNLVFILINLIINFKLIKTECYLWPRTYFTYARKKLQYCNIYSQKEDLVKILDTLQWDRKFKKIIMGKMLEILFS